MCVFTHVHTRALETNFGNIILNSKKKNTNRMLKLLFKSDFFFFYKCVVCPRSVSSDREALTGRGEVLE